MAYQIVQQPSGSYAIFDTVEDMFAVIDATEKEIVAWFVKKARKRAKDETEQTLGIIKRGERAYYQFTMTWKQALEKHRTSGRGFDFDEKFNKQVELAAKDKSK